MQRNLKKFDDDDDIGLRDVKFAMTIMLIVVAIAIVLAIVS
jgi:hypothetical protein